MTDYFVIFLVVLSVSFNVSGQLLLKFGTIKMGILRFTAADLPFIFRKAALNPFVLLSLCCGGLGLLVWLVVLSRADVSYAYPMAALSYVLIAVLAWRFFGENLSPFRILGIFLICLGVFLIARS